MTPQSRIEKVLAEIEYAEKSYLISYQLSDKVPALRKALAFAIESLGPCICDTQHQYTCGLCETVPQIADILEGK